MKGRTAAVVMAVLLALYLVLVGARAVQFMLTGDPVAIAIGVALIVLPIIGAWALWREIDFGFRSQELVRRLDADGAADLGLPVSETGRIDRTDADAAFERFRTDAEAQPESWHAWLRLGLVYDAAGDRRRARKAVRRAIELERAAR